MPKRELDTAYELSAPPRGRALNLPKELLEPHMGKPSPLARNAIILVQGGEAQAEERAPARELYTSTWSTLARDYAELQVNIGAARAWYLISAKHGLVRPSDIISPYEHRFKDKNDEQLRAWSVGVWFRLASVSDMKPSAMIFLAGDESNIALAVAAVKTGMMVEVPMGSLGRPMQEVWLRGQLKKLGVER